MEFYTRFMVSAMELMDPQYFQSNVVTTNEWHDKTRHFSREKESKFAIIGYQFSLSK